MTSVLKLYFENCKKAFLNYKFGKFLYASSLKLYFNEIIFKNKNCIIIIKTIYTYII